MDPTLLAILKFVGGLVLLVKGGDVLVKHAAHMARSFRVPKTIVGAVVIGFGTSLPELFVSVGAAVHGFPSLALGNVIGSNIANVGLILGAGAFMATLHVQRNVLRTDLPLGVLAVLFLLLAASPQALVARWVGLLLLGAFVVYLGLSMRTAMIHRALPFEATKPERHVLLDLLWIVIGLVAITFGSRFLVQGAVHIAEVLNVDERVIGVSLVALGTSLPELAAMVAAARKGETDLAVGNIAGSNLFNLLFVLGVTSVVKPIPLKAISISRDLPVLAAFSVLAFPLFSAERRIGKRQGLLLLLAYSAYIVTTWGWQD